MFDPWSRELQVLKPCSEAKMRGLCTMPQSTISAAFEETCPELFGSTREKQM